MPLPIAQIAVIALRSAAAASLAYGAVRLLGRAGAALAGRTDQRAEDAMDDLDEGFVVHRPADRPQTNAAGRFRRVIRTPGGRAFEIDAAGFARISIRRAGL